MPGTIIDKNYTVAVDNSSNDGASLIYARWSRDDRDITVTETNDSVKILNYEYKVSGDVSDAYITMPLVLLSFAYKNGGNSSVGQKLCCPTNMVGFDSDDANIRDVRKWSYVDQTSVSRNADYIESNKYIPFGYYAAFPVTIENTSILSGLLEYANSELRDNLTINALVLPKTVTSFNINHIHKEGGYNVNIRYLFFQFDARILGLLITDARTGFKDFINGIKSDSTVVCFTDSVAQQIFITNIKNGNIDFIVKRVKSSKGAIKRIVGDDPPDITILTPE